MPPKRRGSIGYLRGELLVGTGDVLPKVEARKIRAPASLRALVGHILHACGALVTGTGEHLALTRDAERTGKVRLVGASLMGDKKGATQSCRSAR